MPIARKRTARRPRRFTRRRAPLKRTVKSIVKSQMNKFIETKKHEFNYNEVQMNSSTTAIQSADGAMILNQGDSYSTMTGHLVNGVGWLSRFILHNNAANPQFVRHLVLECKQGAPTSPATALFEDNTANLNFSSFTTNQWLTARINKDKYRVLQDHIIKLGGTLDTSKIYSYRKYIPLKGCRYTYDGDGATPTTGTIYEFWLSAEADDDATGEVVELTGTQTFYYKDA